MFVVAQGAERTSWRAIRRRSCSGTRAGCRWRRAEEAAAAVVGVDERQVRLDRLADSERAVASSSPKSTLTNVVAPWRRAPMDATP